MADRLSKQGTQMDSKNVSQEYLFKKVERENKRDAIDFLNSCDYDSQEDDLSLESIEDICMPKKKVETKSYFKTNNFTEKPTGTNKSIGINKSTDVIKKNQYNSNSFDEEVVYNSDLLKSVTHNGNYTKKSNSKSGFNKFLVELDENVVDDDDEWERLVAKQKNESKMKSKKNLDYNDDDFVINDLSNSFKNKNNILIGKKTNTKNNSWQLFEDDSYVKNIDFRSEKIDKKYESTRLTNWFKK